MHVHLVADHGLRGILRVELVVGLTVVEYQLERTAEETAGRVEIIDRHRGCLDLLEAVDVEAAGLVENVGDFDRFGRG